jgi:hypothetical protein
MARYIFIFLLVVSLVLLLITIFVPEKSDAQIDNGYFYSLLVRNSFKSPVVTVAGSAGEMTLPSGVIFNITGTTKQTSITTSASESGKIIILITASTDTLVDGGNLKLYADFEGTANDVLVLISDGTNWYELSRSIN